MTERSMLWTDGTGDGGPYAQDRLDDLVRALAGYPSADQGVIRGYEDELEVSESSGDIVVAAGAALVDGKVYDNDGDETLTVTTPSVGTTGKRVVLRKSWSAQTVRAEIISSADGTATIPDVTQSDGVTWEISLATFTITTGGTIGSLTDDRTFLDAPNLNQSAVPVAVGRISSGNTIEFGFGIESSSGTSEKTITFSQAVEVVIATPMDDNDRPVFRVSDDLPGTTVVIESTDAAGAAQTVGWYIVAYA